MRHKTRMTVLLAVVAALSAGEALAQRGLPGQIAVGVSVGTTDGFLMRGPQADYRFWCGVDAVRYNRNRTYWNFGAELLRKDYTYRGYLGRERVPMAQFTAEAGYNVPVLADRGCNITLAVGASALVGYETTAWGRKELGDGATLLSRDAFLWGGAFSVALEGYLSDRVVLLLRFKERCMPSSPTGAFHTQIGFGIRIIIN